MSICHWPDARKLVRAVAQGTVNGDCDDVTVQEKEDSDGAGVTLGWKGPM